MRTQVEVIDDIRDIGHSIGRILLVSSQFVRELGSSCVSTGLSLAALSWHTLGPNLPTLLVILTTLVLVFIHLVDDRIGSVNLQLICVM